MNELGWREHDLEKLGQHVLVEHDGDVDQVSMSCTTCSQIFLLGEFNAQYHARRVVRALLDDLGY